MEIVDFQKDEFIISTDPGLIDVDVVHNYLANESYWAQGRARDVVERSIENSLCFGVYNDAGQIGFARVVTDFSVFAYILDLYILSDFGGQGLGKWLMSCILIHPEMQGDLKWALCTSDAHGLYEKFNFKHLENSEKWMTMHGGFRQN
jgi:GNAT superfamily N-acetyltransferase